MEAKANTFRIGCTASLCNNEKLAAPEASTCLWTVTAVPCDTGRASGNTMAIVAAEAPESSSHTGKGALVTQNADAAAPNWFSQFMNMDQAHKQTQMEKLHNMDQNSQLVLNKMEDMQVSLSSTLMAP